MDQRAMLVAYAARILRRHPQIEPEDIVQAVYARSLAARPYLPTCRSWLYSCVKNEAFSRMREASRFAPIAAIEARGPAIDSAIELRADLHRALLGLPPQLRRVMVWLARGVPISDMAHAEGSSPSAIKARIARAKRLLREKLADYGDQTTRSTLIGCMQLLYWSSIPLQGTIACSDGHIILPAVADIDVEDINARLTEIANTFDHLPPSVSDMSAALENSGFVPVEFGTQPAFAVRAADPSAPSAPAPTPSALPDDQIAPGIEPEAPASTAPAPPVEQTPPAAPEPPVIETPTAPAADDAPFEFPPSDGFERGEDVGQL